MRPDRGFRRIAPNQQHEEAVVDNAPPDVIEGATIVDAFRANVRSIPERPAMRRRTHNG